MLAYINGILLDGSEDMTPQYGKTVLVKNGKIEAILNNGDVVPGGYKKIDLNGSYLLPGLINLHVHIPATGKPKGKPLDPKKLVKTLTANRLARAVLKRMYQKYVQIDLMSGVTTIRSVGGVDNYDTMTRDRIDAGKVLGPRILAGDMAISVPGGHMAGSVAVEVSSPEEACAYVRKIAAAKPDLIKLMITGGVMDAEKVGEPGILKMSPEIVRAACDEAKNLGYYVAAHVEGSEGLKVALENGVHTIEHGAAPTDETIELFKEKKAALVATISPTIPYALFDTEVSKCGETGKINGKVVMDGIIDCAKACLANGIPVGLGTDTGVTYITHYDFWRELVYFQKYCGVSNAFALYTATKRNAEIAGIGNETGSIEIGKSADFIIVDKNPLENLRVLRNVRMVSIRGKLIRNPKIRKIEDVDRELDKIL